MVNSYRLVCIAVLLLAETGKPWAAPLHILTTEVPPLAFSIDGKVSGFCVEVVEEIQRRLGIGAPIEMLPWARAYWRAQSEPNTVLVCPKRSAEREALFQWVGPLLSGNTHIYAKAGSRPALRTLADAKKLQQIMVLRDSYSYQHLTALGFKNLSPVNNSAGMLKMLMADRAPAMVLESVQLHALLPESGVEPSEIKAILSVQSPSSNIAFSLDVPQKTVLQWQAEFDAMKRDGSYRKLVNNWFPKLAQGKRR